jgi:hypothetical protein
MENLDFVWFQLIQFAFKIKISCMWKSFNFNGLYLIRVLKYFKCLTTAHVVCNKTDINLVVADVEYFPLQKQLNSNI